MQHRTVPANPSSPGQEVLQEKAPGAGIIALFMRTTDGIDLQQMRVQWSSLDSDLDVITAPAYVQTLRRLLRQAQRVIDVCSVITLLLTGVLSVTAVWPYRRTHKTDTPSATQAEIPETAYPQIPPRPPLRKGGAKGGIS